MCCKDIRYMLESRNEYTAQANSICYKDKYYMLQRQNVYFAKANLHVAKTQLVCCKDKIYMLQRKTNVHGAKTEPICCKDKYGARCERSRRGFLLPRNLAFSKHILAVLSCKRTK